MENGRQLFVLSAAQEGFHLCGLLSRKTRYQSGGRVTATT